MTPRKLHHAVSALAVAACLTGPAGPASAQDTAFTPPQDFTAIVAEMSPSVVGITARGMAPPQQAMPDGMPMPEPFGAMPGQDAPQREVVAGGSGFMISDDGYIVTNNHVIEGASEIEVVLTDGSTRDATLVGTDPATDIAVLKIDDASDIVVAPWGDSDAMEPGAWTIAIGSPFGLGGTVTVGVLSATSRVIGAGPYDAFLQTDASINSGNSGGPLFNGSGQVIGVNTAIFSPGGGNVGIGLQIEITLTLAERNAERRAESAVPTDDGEPLGVAVSTVPELVRRNLGLQEGEAIMIQNVQPGSAAADAGLMRGDVVLSASGADIGSVDDLSRAWATARDEDRPLLLRINRGGNGLFIAVEPGETPEAAQD
ncbi:MAG: trypsin-like peptidase domain-containing protein [Loktanella sp.]|nr:trypsin-like peptidase domain-containing protein [Loktanella sp.]